MNLQNRLTKLEAEAQAQFVAAQNAALAAFNQWVDANASTQELGAWDRFLLHMPMHTEAERQAVIEAAGVTPAKRAEILADCGPFTQADQATVTAMLLRVPKAIIDAHLESKLDLERLRAAQRGAGENEQQA